MSAEATTARATRLNSGRAGLRGVSALLWSASRTISVLVVGWIVASALTPAAVVASLGVVVGCIPAAVKDGLASAAGSHLILALVIAALIYGFSLILDPVGTALGTAAKTRSG